jgi:hypothetical protein
VGRETSAVNRLPFCVLPWFNSDLAIPDPASSLSMKNHHHNGPITTSRSLLHESIATRAYELWEMHGWPENQADEFWLQAECELVTGRKDPERDPALPVSF